MAIATWGTLGLHKGMLLNKAAKQTKVFISTSHISADVTLYITTSVSQGSSVRFPAIIMKNVYL